MTKIRLSESQLKNIIRKSILNEINQKYKAGGLVKAHNSIPELVRMKNNGQKYFVKNGRIVDIDNEIARKERQKTTFGDGFAHDLSIEHGENGAEFKKKLEYYRSQIKELTKQIAAMEEKIEQNKGGFEAQAKYKRLVSELQDARRNYGILSTSTNGFKVYADGHNYSIITPKGFVYSDNQGGGINYGDYNSNSNVNRLSKLKDVSDALKGYDEELSGDMETRLGNMKRRRNNWQQIQNYNDAHRRWEKEDAKASEEQNKFDKKPFFMKWGKKRPTRPIEPQKPKWECGADGKYDGYLQSTNPRDHDADIESAYDIINKYKDARSAYFKN